MRATANWLWPLLLAGIIQDPPEVEKLGSDDLTVREKASADLVRRLGETPELAGTLEARLARERDPEIRARLDEILNEAARRRAEREANLDLTETGVAEPVRGRVHSIAMSADGSRLATIGPDDRVFLFDVRAKRPMGTLTGPSRIQAIAWSADGARIAAACDSGPVLVWDVGSLKLTASLKPAGEVSNVLFHPSGKVVAVVSGGPNLGRLLTAEVADGEWTERIQFRVEKSTNVPLGWRDDGRFLNLTLTETDITLAAWDFAAGVNEEIWKESVECNAWRTHVSVSADRTRVALKGFIMEGDRGGTERCIVWDLAAGKKVTEFKAPGWYAHFKDNGTLILWGGRTPGIRAVRATDGEPAGAVGSAEERFTSVRTTGETLAAAREDGTVSVWTRLDAPDATFKTGHAGGIRDAVVSPDGTRLYIVGEDRTLRAWSTDPAKELACASIGDDAFCSLFISGDGKTLALGTRRGVVLYDAATLTATGKVPSRDRPTNSDVAFSPDGKTLLMVDGDLWQHLVVAGTDGRIRRTLGGPGQFWRCVQFSPDGRRILALRSGKSVLLDAETFEETAGPDIGRLACIAFAAGDADRIVSLRGGNRQITVWDLASGRATASDPGEPGESAGGAAGFLQVAGRMIVGAASDHTIVLAAHMSGRANRIIRLREIREGQPVCLSMSHDGRRLAFSTWRRKTRLFLLRIDPR